VTLAAALILLAQQTTVPAQGPAARIEEIATQHRGHWGIYAQRLDTGEVLAERCGNCFFTPASVTKLLTTALALERLGAAHRFSTEVRRHGRDLHLVGGGDPSLSGRAFPYVEGAGMTDAMVPLQALAAAVAARGVTEVDGVVGDDTLWPWRPVPDGWSHDDLTWDFGAPLSALSFAESNLQLTMLPGAKVGDLARLSLSPNVEYFAIDNRLETVAPRSGPRRIVITRLPGMRQLMLTGTIPLGDRGRTETLAVDDPALYAAVAFRQALIREGINVTGEARALHRPPGGNAADAPAGETLVRRASPPLGQLAQVVNKVSQNLHAEMLLEASGGGQSLQDFLTGTLQTPRTEFRFVDGSGLSRLDTITPRALARVLSHMAGQRDFAATLPVGGADGSLRLRFVRPPVGVQAKTGGMTGVQTLAGYVDSRANGRVAFVILVNNDNGPGGVTRAAMDRVVAILAE